MGLPRRLVGILGLLLITVACGGDDGSAASGPSGNSSPDAASTTEDVADPEVVLRITSEKGNTYEQKVLRAPAGVTAELVYTNRSSSAHNVQLVEGRSFTDPVLAIIPTTTDEAPVSRVFQVPEESGRYLFFCRIPGHMKMTGFLIVE